MSTNEHNSVSDTLLFPSSSSSLLSGGSGLSVEHVSLAAIDSTVQYLRYTSVIL